MTPTPVLDTHLLQSHGLLVSDKDDLEAMHTRAHDRGADHEHEGDGQ